jgi:DNA-binding LytR/AlgR family response regulator
MIYHIAICDDEPADGKYLSMLVAKWASSTGNAASADTFPSSEAFLFRYAEDKAYEILLLDIEMSGMDGVQLARTVRKHNQEIQIVFVTGFPDYIAEGYEVEALQYLLKPVDEQKLFAVLDRAAEKLRRNERALLLECCGETVRVPLYEIRYLEVRQNYVTVHAKEDYTVKKTLGQLEKELDDGFFRTGRSFIVSLKAVRKITRSGVLLSDGTSVPLPRGCYEPLNRAMIRYF